MKIKTYITEIEETTCIHCTGKITTNVKYHFEQVPKKNKEWKDIIEKGKTIFVDKKVYDIAPPSLCTKCSNLPKCEGCGWRENIKSNCICGNKIPYDENRFLSCGNCCNRCLGELREKTKHEKDKLLKYTY